MGDTPPRPNNAPQAQHLIVTADDFGIGLETSRGIIRAHLRGPVTATSLMTVTGDRAASSVALLADAPGLEVGLHIVLTGAGEAPLAARGGGLTDRAGRFRSLPRLLLAAWTGRLDRQAVFAEIAAQARKFQDLMGGPPAYVDAHHHAHQLPVVRSALLEAMAAGLLPRITRLTAECPAVARDVSSARLRRRVARSLAAKSRPEFRQAGVWANDWFFGMLNDTELDAPSPWQAYLDRLPPGVSEWGVHPGLPDESLEGRDSYMTQRVKELRALTEHRESWERYRPVLTTKGRLWPGPADIPGG